MNVTTRSARTRRSTVRRAVMATMLAAGVVLGGAGAGHALTIPLPIPNPIPPPGSFGPPPIVGNGGFEAPRVAYNTVGSFAAGSRLGTCGAAFYRGGLQSGCWTVAGGAAQIANAVWAPASGRQSVRFGARVGGASIQQGVAMKSDRLYSLSFSMEANPQHPTWVSLRVLVLFRNSVGTVLGYKQVSVSQGPGGFGVKTTLLNPPPGTTNASLSLAYAPAAGEFADPLAAPVVDNVKITPGSPII